MRILQNATVRAPDPARLPSRQQVTDHNIYKDTQNTGEINTRGKTERLTKLGKGKQILGNGFGGLDGGVSEEWDEQHNIG